MFDPEQVCPARFLEELYALPQGRLERYSMFRGHFGRYLNDRLGKSQRAVTILRDPVLRTLSHWHQIKRNTNDPRHLRVREQSFDEFVADDENRPVIQDFQARYLAAPAQSLETLAVGLDPRKLETFQLSQRAHEASLTIAPDHLFRNACESLDKMEAVGTTDDVHGFLRDCASKLGWPQPAPEDVPWINATEKTLTFEIAAPTSGALRRSRK